MLERTYARADAYNIHAHTSIYLYITIIVGLLSSFKFGAI